MYINLHTHRKPQSHREHSIRNAYSTLNERFLHQVHYALSVGIHPWLVSENWKAEFIDIERHVLSPSVVAIGECGLDRLKGPHLEMQTEVLEAHIHLANQHQKPLILHLVKTYSDMLSLAKGIHIPWIVHGFKGNYISAKNLIDKGACLSFGPRLMLEKELQNLFKQLPLNQIYLETDTKPVLIDSVYTFAAELLEKSTDELENIIQENFERDFSVVLPKL